MRELTPGAELRLSYCYGTKQMSWTVVAQAAGYATLRTPFKRNTLEVVPLSQLTEWLTHGILTVHHGPTRRP